MSAAQAQAHCKHCGDPFPKTRRDRVFCAKLCADLYQSTRIAKPLTEITCRYCRESFKPKHPGQTHYCSDRCRRAVRAQRKRQIRAGNPPNAMQYLDCEQCGNGFHQRATNQIYCSRRCRMDAYNGRRDRLRSRLAKGEPPHRPNNPGRKLTPDGLEIGSNRWAARMLENLRG